MPLYFFDVTNGPHSHSDQVGEELPSRHAAWAHATRYAGEAIKDIDGSLQTGECWQLEVRDESSNRIYVLQVRTMGQE